MCQWFSVTKTLTYYEHLRSFMASNELEYKLLAQIRVKGFFFTRPSLKVAFSCRDLNSDNND